MVWAAQRPLLPYIKINPNFHSKVQLLPTGDRNKVVDIIIWFINSTSTQNLQKVPVIFSELLQMLRTSK